MKRKSLIGKTFISLLLISVILSNCTSSDDNAHKPATVSDSATSNVQLNTSSKRDQAGPRSITVEIKKMKFNPEEITVQKGDTVIWINQDMVPHCITEDKTKAWTSAVLESGASWKKVVTTGADYHCAIHQVMKGKILVQ